MKLPLLFIPLTMAATALAEVREARELLIRDAAQAAEHLQALLAQRPNDPWLRYNAGVAAYAAKDFARADETWQQLAATDLPDRLREQVWLQIGNVSYRLAQPQIATEPDAAVPRLEQSREALRVALAANKRNKTAARNLPVVEKALEDVYARLAQRLLTEGRKEGSIERAIEKLQAALTYAQQAQDLNPQDAQREAEKKEIEKTLGAKLDDKAARHEKTADQRNQDNEWERKNAQEEFQKALDHFQEAQALDPQDQIAQAGEKRVQEKLANLFSKAGREDQREAQQTARHDPEEAAQKFDDALANFQEALAQMPEHQDALAGEKEVREQLEQLHLNAGDRQAQQGEQQMARAPQQAAENLLGALDHFEQARALNPENPTIPPRIEKVQSQLPDLLTKLGQQEQRQGERAEQRGSVEQAVSHLERAETSFDKAQQFSPGNETAKTGQQEVQQALARLRQQMAQRPGQQPPQQPSTPQEQREAQDSFQSMLARVKDDERQRETQARHHPGQKYQEERGRTLRNW